MTLKKISTILFIVISMYSFGQKTNPVFYNIECELPTIQPGGLNFVSQQFSTGTGYQLSDSFGLYLNCGSGLLVENAKNAGPGRLFGQIALGADYLVPFKKTRFGIDIKAGINSTTDKNYEHASYQIGLKLQGFQQHSATIGVRNRELYNIGKNYTEIFCSFGYKIFPETKNILPSSQQ
jgi:hypothetical protein